MGVNHGTAGFATPDGSQHSVRLSKIMRTLHGVPEDLVLPAESDFAHSFLDFGTLQFKSF